MSFTKRPPMSLAVGQTVRNGEVIRQITEVRLTGYSWIYPDAPDRGDFISENSNDQFFEHGWSMKEMGDE